MQSINFDEVLDDILRRDARYTREAYHFVREALDFTQRRVHKDERKGAPEHRHVTGRDLLEGLREYALAAMGPMAFFTLSDWGIHCCEDVGEIVFNLVDHGKGMFGKTDTDSREDFKGGFDFHEAFRQPFQASSRFVQAANRGARTMSPSTTE